MFLYTLYFLDGVVASAVVADDVKLTTANTGKPRTKVIMFCLLP